MLADDVCSPSRLMSLVRSGDPAALDQITRCYSQRLLAAGRRYCRTATEAEDAVQDALLSAATRLDQFRGEGSLEGWLVRIVATACNRISRGQKNAVHGDAADLELPGASESPETEAARNELLGLIDEALLGLPPEDRAVLLLAE